MTDKKKVGAMEIMNLLIASALVAQGDLVRLLAFRMVKATIRHGLTGASAVGLCVMGTVLCNHGEIERGVWCSDVGMELVELLGDKSVKGRVMAIHWGLLCRYVKPWKICQEPLKVAYRLCIEGGDNEVSKNERRIPCWRNVVF
jgi:hypothetical protein